jgi:hypothetical protein
MNPEIIEAPRNKLRGIFDPLRGIFYSCSLTPQQAGRECTRGDSVCKNEFFSANYASCISLT